MLGDIKPDFIGLYAIGIILAYNLSPFIIMDIFST
jgi:hypothetical protein